MADIFMNKRRLHVLIGPILFGLCILFLPNSIFSSLSIKVAIGTIAWIAYWWVTSPIDYAVTAFLPIIINALFQVTDMSKVISNYSSETILLLFGASILTSSWGIIGLDKRIALLCLSRVGGNFKKQLIFWFLISFFLSSILPNSVVCAIIIPIVYGMLEYVGESNISESKHGSKLLLYITYAIGLGGLATPLGGDMNLVIIDYIQKYTGVEYYYFEWVIKFLPVIIPILLLNIIFMIRGIDSADNLKGSKEYFINEYKKLSAISKEEKLSLLLFVIASLMSFLRSFFASILPGLKPAYIFIVAAILSFLITNKQGERIITWKIIQGRVVFGLIFVFAGGLAAGTLIKESGAASAIGNIVVSLNMVEKPQICLIIIVLCMIMTNITSNTAAAAVMSPIIISMISYLELDVTYYIYIVAASINLAYIFPTSIRAIPVGYGLQPKYIFKEGIKITLLIILLLMIIYCI